MFPSAPQPRFAFLTVGNNCDYATDGSITLTQECALNSQNWRLMLAIPGILPIIPMVIILLLPESPRFLLKKALAHQRDPDKANYYNCKAIKSLEMLNKTRLQAFRELFLIYHSLKKEGEGRQYRTVMAKELWSHPRTRRALVSSMLVMFLQQACGVNILAYYLTSVLGRLSLDKDHISTDAFKYSIGFGAINFGFVFFAFSLIDTWGRRGLLLLTFPVLGILQILTGVGVGFGSSPSTNNHSNILAIVSTYLYCAVYSVGEGPLPFVYASESMPLDYRDFGMGVATSVNWFFNALLGLTWPFFYEQAHGWGFITYGILCFLGFFPIFLYVRETKGKALEEMELVFTPSNALFRQYAWKELKWFFRCLRKGTLQLKKESLEDCARSQGEATGAEHSQGRVGLATSRGT